MAYENLVEGGLSYYPCRYGKSKLLFRGPRKQLKGSYLACLGATETYGRFVEFPWPDLLEERLGMPCVNLGYPNAGIDVFLGDGEVIAVAQGAERVVLQILGAHNMSNRFYSVHPRRNDRFLKASRFLSAIYRDVDFTDFHFTRHLLQTLREHSEERFELVRAELRESWVARMNLLIGRIGRPVTLLWMSDHGPDAPGGESLAGGGGPLFVDRAMIEEVAAGSKAEGFVEIVVPRDPDGAHLDDMVYAPLEEPAALEMLGVEAHEAAAEALARHLGPDRDAD